MLTRNCENGQKSLVGTQRKTNQHVTTDDNVSYWFLCKLSFIDLLQVLLIHVLLIILITNAQ